MRSKYTRRIVKPNLHKWRVLGNARKVRLQRAVQKCSLKADGNLDPVDLVKGFLEKIKIGDLMRADSPPTKIKLALSGRKTSESH